MKIKLLLAFLLILFTGCSLSEVDVQKATEVDVQKAIEETLSVMLTSIVTYTPNPTYTPWVVTATFIKGMTIQTPIPLIISTVKPDNPVYIEEEGFCIISVGDVGGDPKNEPGCGVTKRYQIEIPIGGERVTILNENKGDIEIYCALFDLNGNFIVSDIDTAGSGIVRCKPSP